jgi:UDP-N-acetylglucosamine 2-epimerase (non-hydrolysing)
MIAFNMKCRVVHLEAGLRTYNNKEPYPEEINRRIIGTICDVHLCPTIRNYNNLKSERIQTQIEVVGNTIIDALQFIKSKYNLELPKTILQHLSNSKYILVTAHRRESFGKGILNICHAILRLSELYPSIDFVYPVHPNPNVKTVVNEKLSGKKNIILLEPVDYITMLSIINNSLLCMSDSGGIQEEAPSFNKFTVVLRNFSERMESVECGYSFLVGTEPQAIIDKVTELLNSANFEEKLINPYGDGQASQRIISLLQKISPE